ncbi:MerR family transcriptional regulator [Companilactobacillus allii]|uniref:HTH merR-type domain-containing protein n=1 Tax=Companilactobacillus allii TaxID=1847728 RepID=A0A1P8Q125_9LACO|nr:MerR family transcriptional regulator [Companilactobacillus allii]APX71527.1 hypothetical protein BTM29_02670 [Companilactobacillus allii]USQ68609.1 MerR family transcriptional regulator [Companilactobacillus allii]
MSEYTTGEIAKKVNVSVRTIQYYDKKNILCPTQITESGRRLYSDNDLNKLKLIMLLKSMGLSLNSIKDILSSNNSTKIMILLLTEQKKSLQSQAKEADQKIKVVDNFLNGLSDMDNFPINSVEDIDYIMNNKQSLRRVHVRMILFGLPIDIVEIATLIYSIKSGNWWIFGLGMLVAIAGACWLTKYYFGSVNYICPNCNTIFKPRFKEAFFAKHTIKTRKLTCPNCGEKDFCVEVFNEDK